MRGPRAAGARQDPPVDEKYREEFSRSAFHPPVLSTTTVRACVRASARAMMMRCNRVEQITCYVVTVSPLGPVYNFRLVSGTLVHVSFSYSPFLSFLYIAEKESYLWNNEAESSSSDTATLSRHSSLYPVSSLRVFRARGAIITFLSLISR